MSIIQSKHNKNAYCIDVPGGTPQENNPIIVYKCHGSLNQKFRHSRKQIRSTLTNKCLDVNKYNVVVQRRCNRKSKTQKWIRDKKRRFVNVASRKCLDVEGGEYKNGNLITFPCHSGKNQKFTTHKHLYSRS
jgi:hypothetical protein